MTRQRQAILEALRRAETHPTADEVHRMVRRVLPRVGLATVYRGLEALSQAGLIRSLGAAQAPRRYDGEVGRHYHVRCLRCGRVGDVEMAAPASVERAARRGTGFQIVGHRLEFLGICPRCRGEDRRRRGPREPRETGRTGG